MQESEWEAQETVLPLLNRISPPPGLGIETAAPAKENVPEEPQPEVVRTEGVSPGLIWALVVGFLIVVAFGSVALFLRLRQPGKLRAK
jgi:hypothetical protein